MIAEFHQIVYYSTIRPSLDPEKTVDDILAVAREMNVLLGVTGMLIYNGGRFIQVLEGDRETITKLYGKICMDIRHYNIATLLSYSNGERLFENWSMGYKNLEDTDKDLSEHKSLMESILVKSQNHTKADYREIQSLLKRFRFS